MQTKFTAEQLQTPSVAASETIIRKCVHCGFCTATCPTYVLLRDELDSPRGRIYLIKDMLENGREPTEKVVRHVDRCLSCLSCMTTCPSDVNYMHLIDTARAYIEERYRRSAAQRIYRNLLLLILPNSRRFRWALGLARRCKSLIPLVEKIKGLEPLKAMLELAPSSLPAPASADSAVALGPRRGRVILLRGCVEPVLAPHIRAAAVRVLNRAGYDVVSVAKEGCCGALAHHMGRESAGLDAIRRNVDAWSLELEVSGIDAICVTASGCGTAIKDYGYVLRNDPVYARRAARISSLAVDISELLPQMSSGSQIPDLVVAYHAPCSLQHAQKVTEAPKRLLAAAGFRVRVPAESHICCGSAGTYNILQPEIANALGERKQSALAALDPDVIATGNVGCAVHIGRRSAIPVVHTVELLDWAAGGPVPANLVGGRSMSSVASQ